MKDIGFIILPSYYKAIQYFGDDMRLEAYDALLHYGFTGEVKEGLSPMVEMYLTSISPTIDNTKKRYVSSVENGKKGGRPKKTEVVNQVKPNDNLKGTNQVKPTPNLNKDKDKERDMDKEKEKEKESDMDMENESDNNLSTSTGTNIITEIVIENDFNTPYQEETF